MYQFSRAIYRELVGELAAGRGWACENQRKLLSACESAVERLAADRHYFARPARTLFRDVRPLFPLRYQAHVYEVIERNMLLATEYVDQHAAEGMTFDGSPLCCHATTRKGTACQRVPLPGSRYCPSHKHLDEEFEVAAA